MYNWRESPSMHMMWCVCVYVLAAVIVLFSLSNIKIKKDHPRRTSTRESNRRNLSICYLIAQHSNKSNETLRVCAVKLEEKKRHTISCVILFLL